MNDAQERAGNWVFTQVNHCNDAEAILAFLTVAGGWVPLSKLHARQFLPSVSPNAWVLQKLVRDGRIELRSRGCGTSARAK